MQMEFDLVVELARSLTRKGKCVAVLVRACCGAVLVEQPPEDAEWLIRDRLNGEAAGSCEISSD